MSAPIHSSPDVARRLDILTGAARYDASCASSGSARSAGRKGMGNTQPSGVCHSWSSDGRCISLLKILMTNRCMYDCAYCINRVSNDIPRASLNVKEIVDITVEFYRRNYIEGLFLSSGVVRSPDHTMERMLTVVEQLRRQQFGGYVHLKTIPGASKELVLRAGLVADRLSVNIELPSENSLIRLAPGKTKQAILKPMACIGQHWNDSRQERRRNRKAPTFSPAGQSTQLIVGATPESDQHILLLSEGLYRKYLLKRVYFSAYVPIRTDGDLPAPDTGADLLREHRLYQADWLVREYGFGAAELADDGHAFLDRQVDPKAAWALRHFDRFPVDIQRATREELLRVPGIGKLSADRILAARRHSVLDVDALVRIGVVARRARFFVACRGRYAAEARLSPDLIRTQLLPRLTRRPNEASQMEMNLPL
jgi:putative DNA modification/repair radical SAM protein